MSSPLNTSGDYPQRPANRYRIGLVTPYFLPQIGGAKIYCFELARALASLGHEIHLFTVPGALEDAAYISHPVLTMNLHEDLDALASYDMDIWHALFFYYTPLALKKPNVFVTGHGDDCFSFRIRMPLPGRQWLKRHLAWRLSTKLRDSLDARLHTTEIWRNHRLYGKAIRHTRRIIAVSNFTRARLVERWPIASSKLSIIPPGVNEQFFLVAPQVADKPPGAPVKLLSVTRLDEQDRIKNIHGVISALASLKDRFDFRYHVVSGDSWCSYKQELTDQIAAAGLGDRVFLEGRKGLKQLIRTYQEADLFVLVSYAEADNFEGFGIVFLEANAGGVPVLSSRQGGMADYIKQGQNGFYVEDPTVGGIRQALERFFSGKIRFDRNTVRRYPEPYRWTQIAERVLALYDEYRT